MGVPFRLSRSFFIAGVAIFSDPHFAAGQMVQELQPGKVIERTLSASEVHTYHVHACVAQYLRFELEPNGADFTATLLSPAGEKIAEALNPPGGTRTVAISEAVPVEGDYQLQIAKGGPIAGKYRLKVAELRPVQSADEKRIAAERAFAEGRLLRLQASKASLDRAVEKFQLALPSWRELNDRESEAHTLMQLGSAHFALGDANKYSEYESEALSIWRSLGDRKGEGEALNSLGLAHWARGELDLALEKLREALPLRKEAGDRWGEATTLHNLSTVYSEMGDLQVALRLKLDVLEQWRALGGRDEEARVLNDLAVTYSKLGNPERVLEYLNQALVLNRRIGNRRSEATNLLNIGTEYAKLSEPRKALDNQMSALKLLRETGDRAGESVALQHIGRAHALLGDQTQALEYFDQALAIQRSIQLRRPEAYTCKYMAEMFLELRRASEALARLKECLVLGRGIGDRLHEAETLAAMAQAHRDEGDLERALIRIEESVRLTETVRSSVASEELRTSYLATNLGRYNLLIDVLMNLQSRKLGEGYAVRALEVSERARARGLLDLLTEARAEIREGVDLALLKREQSLRTSLDQKTQRQIRLLSGAHTASQAANMEREIRALTLQYEEVEADLRARSPRYASLTQPQALQVKEIQQLLDADTALLEYALGEPRSYLWVVSLTSVDSFELPKRAEVEAAARKAYEELSVHSQVAGNGPAVETLSRMLLGGTTGLLRKKRLAVVTDGALQYIPFAALTMPGEKGVLVENHEVVHLPSASTLAVLRREVSARKPAPKLVAVLADPVFDRNDPRVLRAEGPSGSGPPSGNLERSAREAGILTLDRLRASRQEAQAIVHLAGASNSLQALDFQASRKTATSGKLGDYRIVHFATHGLLNSQHPELSGLVLSLVDRDGKPQDGFLQAAEAYNLKLGADIVVLSACQTALGKEVRGEGLVGLTRGFMYAGAPRVMASLWRVPDQATTELMKRFYQSVLGKGMRPAAALQAAQATLRNDRRWTAPYYWAGFVLQGEWR